MISDGITRSQMNVLAALIALRGYRCDSVSLVRPFLFSRGFHVTCIHWDYRYEVADRGGKWVVTLK